MELDEQRHIIERALAERMINHAVAIMSQWAQEVGYAVYSDRIHSLLDNYRATFDYFLAQADEDRDEVLDGLTHDAYCLADEIYGDLRIKRNLSPQLQGFNPDDTNSVITYFSTCVHLQEEDLNWLREVIHDTTQSAVALMAMAALATNLREVFQEDALYVLIEAAHSENELVSNQALPFVCLLMTQWDARVDFYPDLQDAFMDYVAPNDMAFQALERLVHVSGADLTELLQEQNEVLDELPEELRGIDEIPQQMPKSEQEYIQAVVEILPQTWVFDILVGEDEDRRHELALAYLAIGNMTLMWEDIDEAEQWLVDRLRSDKATPADYINYGHCNFIRGDRTLAYENYREAREQLHAARAFMKLFRPSRKMLVDKGVSLEQVYMMEDQLLRLDN